MGVEVVTKEDLESFRLRLLDDLKKIIQPPQPARKELLRSWEVRKILKISPGTLNNLRIARKLKPSKNGGILYYKYEDIEKMLDAAGKGQP